MAARDVPMLDNEGREVKSMQVDLRVDFHRIDEDGLTLANARHARAGLHLHRDDYVVVGADDCEPALARVVELDEDGFMRLRVLPGDAADYPDLLAKAAAVGAS